MTRRSKVIGLPAYPNAFVGRGHNVQAITALLAAEQRRLVTILGPGGMGKTRLAVRIGESIAAAFADGVCFVELDTVDEAGQVPLYIGHRLGLTVRVTSEWTDEIIRYLQDKHLLLILDNLEQVLDAADTIARLVATCPRLQVLVTSREVLGLSFEVEYTLDSLSRPNSQLFPGPGDLRKFAAIDLFVQTARLSVPEFTITEANASAIVQICEELEGAPLPIELAAARVKLFTPTHLLQQLRQNNSLLKTRARDVVPRHQTIDNTIRWSYDLLTPEEQQFFQQLSLFKGGFTPEAIARIYPEHDPLEMIESLLNKSLVMRDASSVQPRFRMLKLIRDFGLRSLCQSTAVAECYRRFADYFYDFIIHEQEEKDATGWISAVEAEYENLGVTLDWLIDNRPWAAARMGADLWRFHLKRGFLQEGLGLVERLLELAEIDPEVHARLLAGAGVLSQNLGHYPEALAFFNQSLVVWQSLANDREISQVLSHTAWTEWRVGRYQSSLANSRRALQLAEKRSEASARAKALNNQAWVYFFQGRVVTAEQLQRAILHIHTQENNPRGVAFARINLGWVLTYTGQFQEAEQLIDRGIADFAYLKDQQLLTFAHLVRADFLFAAGEREAARNLLLAQCLPEFARIGDLWGEAVSWQRLGRITFLEEAGQEAQSHLQRASELFQRSQDRFGCSLTRLWLAKIARRNGAEQRAEELLRAALESALPMGVNDLLRAIYHELGQLYLEKEKRPPAAVYFAAATYYGTQCGAYRLDRLLADLAPHRSWITAQLGSPSEALEDYASPLSLAELTDQPVTAIAYEIGYRDSDYFYRVFKQTYRITPSEFREARSKS